MEEKGIFYMSIEDPDHFRRELLGTSKMIIQLLQKYEDLRKLREEKISLMFKFSDMMEEITMLVGKLKQAVPKTSLPNMGKQNDAPEKKAKIVRMPKLQSPEIGMLQRELVEIEAKLGKLK